MRVSSRNAESVIIESLALLCVTHIRLQGENVLVSYILFILYQFTSVYVNLYHFSYRYVGSF